jgi:ABC-type transport system substrate-binding protein
MWRKFFVVSSMLLIALTTQAQDDRSAIGGVIRESSWNGESVICDPYSSSSLFCSRYTQLAFPRMFSTDLTTGAIVSASVGTGGVIETAIDPSTNQQRLTVLDGLTWSDGAPISAYDVLYSLITESFQRGIQTDEIQAVRFVNEQQIEILFYNADCSTSSHNNPIILPSHIFAPNFKAFVDDFSFEGDIVERTLVFLDEYRQIFKYNPSMEINNSNMRFVDYRPGIDARLASTDNQIAYVGIQPNSAFSQNQSVETFLANETNLLSSVPFNRVAELQTRFDITVHEVYNSDRFFIQLNVADTRESVPGLDADDNLIDQGVNQFFGDVRVRRAIQHAINVPELIDIALLGYGNPLASFQAQNSWAYDPALQPIAYDLDTATRLLDEAGWRDVGLDGVLDCATCDNAEIGTSFIFSLSVSPDSEVEQIIADLIAKQLAVVGIIADVQFDSVNSFSDASLIRMSSTMVDPDPSRYFSPYADDGLIFRQNVGSFVSSVEDQITEAREMVGCPLEERRNLYQDIDRVLQEEQAAIWLFSVPRFVAVRGIEGFQPLNTTTNLFWNVEDWSIRQ